MQSSELPVIPNQPLRVLCQEKLNSIFSVTVVMRHYSEKKYSERILHTTFTMANEE